MSVPEPSLTTTWPQVLAWRMGQQWLDPLGTASAVDVVRRLCGVQSQVPSAANLAVAVRQKEPDLGAVQAALDDRSLMRTWAMRGTLHLLPPDEAGAYLSLVGAARSWEKASWTKHFGPTPAEMAELVDLVGEILDDRVLTRDELVTEIGDRLGHPQLEKQLRSGWGMLLKPIAWQGQLCYGPSQGTKVTFTRPSSRYEDWSGVPEPDEAARIAIPAYLRAYGPASPETFDAWLTRGVSRKAQLRGWFADLGDELVTVEVEGSDGGGKPLYLRAEDVDALAETKAESSSKTKSTVRLLPAFDQYVLGPGTKDTEIVPAEHRSDVSRPAGWISPVVVASGRVVGVWEVTDDTADVRLFADADPVASSVLDKEVKRVSALARRVPAADAAADADPAET